MRGLQLTEKDDSVRFQVHVQPRARKEGIVGIRDGALWVRVGAPPVGGAANRALIRLLAERLDVRQGDVSIIRGKAARQKLVAVRGVDARYVEDILSK